MRSVVTQMGLQGMQTRLARLVDEGAQAALVADLAVTLWLRVDAVLSPIFGRQGVSALFMRSVHLARGRYPWLDEARTCTAGANGANEGAAASECDALRSVLAQHEPSLALEANGWLLKTFCDLLARLLGEALSQKLLQPVWRALPISSSNHSNHNHNHNHNTIGSVVQDAFQ